MMKHITVILGGGLLLIALAAEATPQIEVSVSPTYGFEPVNLVVAVVTASHADNRILRVVAESEEFVSSSDRQLEGSGSPRVARFEFRAIPAGAYEIRATLIGPNGKVRAEADAAAMVISRDF
jgi:hypothetical protein